MNIKYLALFSEKCIKIKWVGVRKIKCNRLENNGWFFLF